MKVLGASVLVAESMTLGFAILIAMKDQSQAAIIYGCVVSFLLFVAAGLLRFPGFTAAGCDDRFRICRAILLHYWGGFDWSLGGSHHRGP
jgi:hypothetical protein